MLSPIKRLKANIGCRFLKKVSEKHRKILTDLTTQAQINPNVDISDLVAKELNDSITKINEMASNVAGNGAVKSLITNTALNFAGLIPFTYAVLIPLTAVLCGKDLFEFFIPLSISTATPLRYPLEAKFSKKLSLACCIIAFTVSW